MKIFQTCSLMPINSNLNLKEQYIYWTYWQHNRNKIIFYVDASHPFFMQVSPCYGTEIILLNYNLYMCDVCLTILHKLCFICAKYISYNLITNKNKRPLLEPFMSQPQNICFNLSFSHYRLLSHLGVRPEKYQNTRNQQSSWNPLYTKANRTRINIYIFSLKDQTLTNLTLKWIKEIVIIHKNYTGNAGVQQDTVPICVHVLRRMQDTWWPWFFYLICDMIC